MLAVALNTQAVPDVLLSPVLNTQAVSVLLSPVLSPHVRLRSALASTLVSRMTSRRSPTWCPPWPRFSTSSRTRTSLLYLIWSIRWLSFPTSGVAWWGHFYLFTSQNEPTFSSFNFIKPKQLHQLNCLFFSSFNSGFSLDVFQLVNSLDGKVNLDWGIVSCLIIIQSAHLMAPRSQSRHGPGQGSVWAPWGPMALTHWLTTPDNTTPLLHSRPCLW